MKPIKITAATAAATKTVLEQWVKQIAFQEVYAARHPECRVTQRQLSSKYDLACMWANVPDAR